jgi:hypothetical protein
MDQITAKRRMAHEAEDAAGLSERCSPGIAVPVAVCELLAILSGPLPVLPAGDVGAVAAELRRMATPAARQTWRHDGWAALIGWIARRVPDCDPTVPAIHAVRRAPLVRQTPSVASRVGRLVLAVARNSPADRARVELPLDWEPAAEPGVSHGVSQSLVDEVVRLFRLGDITPNPAAWAAICPGVDIAADWWDGFASHTGLGGNDLVAAARDAASMSSEWRLRRYLGGPAGRPLVALLLGGDQWGRAARLASGREASLLLWALDLRRARCSAQPDPRPPTAVLRAWSTTVRLIETAVSRAPEVGPDWGPTVAA